MTYPGFPYPPYTPLFPSYHRIQAYYDDFAARFNLRPYIRFNHSLEQAYWVGNSSNGFWELSISTDGHRKEVIPFDGTSVHDLPHRPRITRRFEHLVVAIGHYHYPKFPPWATDAAAKEWLRNVEGRTILHSIYFREPEEYAERVVLVVGGGASGRDIATHVNRHAKKVCLDLNHVCGFRQVIEAIFRFIILAQSIRRGESLLLVRPTRLEQGASPLQLSSLKTVRKFLTSKSSSSLLDTSTVFLFWTHRTLTTNLLKIPPPTNDARL